jgi:hypothetical protein
MMMPLSKRNILENMILTVKPIQLYPIGATGKRMRDIFSKTNQERTGSRF